MATLLTELHGGSEETMQEALLRDDEFWPSSFRLTLVREECEDLGMYLEGRRDCKRKREAMDDRRDDKERRPPKNVVGSGDMGAACGSSPHLTHGWPDNALEIDLAGELSMNEALLSLPSLTVFKQEAPSPPGGAAGARGATLSPRRAWLQQRRAADERQQLSEEMAVETGEMATQELCQPTHQTELYSPTLDENKGNGLLMCSPSGSLDGFLQSPMAQQRPVIVSADSSFRDDLRFQYVLAAATSMATKTTEETLTYLNQGQPYEIKLKKLGDLSHYKGKMFKSVVKICFHERRLQYMESEQMAQWHSERPGERIVEVDVPLSYGLIRVNQPTERHLLNCIEILWDPTKDTGVYIKVNCISTEFTAKKHGGEKGVPFRVQVETFLPTHETDRRVHAAACQIKVFKLKGADRKHKQDREKVLRRPRTDYDKYQPGCDCTVLATLQSDAVLPASVISTSPSSSPELGVSASKLGNVLPVIPAPQSSMLPAACGPLKQLYCHDNDVKLSSPPARRSPAGAPPAASPDAPVAGLAADASHADTQAWLARQRLPQHAASFADFCGADLLRLSRDDLIQICGLADGIRLFNALRSKRIEPRLTVYVCAVGGVYTAVYLNGCTAAELLAELLKLSGSHETVTDTLLVTGPGETRVYVTDELVRHLPDNSTFRLQRLDGALLLTPTHH